MIVSTGPAGCRAQSAPRLRCRGAAPEIADADAWFAAHTDLAIRDVGRGEQRGRPATPVIARHPFDVAKPHWQQRLCAPQCVTPSLGLPYRVFRISSAIRSSSIIRGLPGRRPSLSPLIHFSRKLARHVPTVAFLRPKREATAGYSRGRTPEAFCNSGHLGCAGSGGGLVIICG